MKFIGARILGILKKSRRYTFVLIALGRSKDTVDQARHAIDEYAGGKLTARQNIVADRYLLVNDLVKDSL